MEPLAIIALVCIVILCACVWALCSRLDKVEEKIRILESALQYIHNQNALVQTDLDTFAEKWDAELDKPDQHKGE